MFKIIIWPNYEAKINVLIFLLHDAAFFIHTHHSAISMKPECMTNLELLQRPATLYDSVYAYWSGNHWSYRASAPESSLVHSLYQHGKQILWLKPCCLVSVYFIMRWVRKNELLISVQWLLTEATWIFFGDRSLLAGVLHAACVFAAVPVCENQTAEAPLA